MFKNRTFIKLGCIAIILLMVFPGCNEPNALADPLFTKFKNESFKELDTAGYNPVFRKVLAEKRSGLKYADLIDSYYKSNHYQPVFVVEFLPKDDLKLVLDHFSKAKEHGLNPELFNYTELKQLVDKFYNEKSIKTPGEAYRNMALLELKSAESLIYYSNTLQYGLVNPNKIFANYFMNTLQADTAGMLNVFSIRNMKAYLDSIQPKKYGYGILQKALTEKYVYPGLSAEETRQAILVNMERLRWKNKPVTDRYVWVNIADYTLKFVENNRTKLAMKVCVGRNISVGKNSHQTPQLNSEMYNAQVNPVWNIPESIIKNEIYRKMARNPSYLRNSRISVYKGGKKISPGAINWSAGSRGGYAFQQAPGNYNSLGKIKFQFLNASSVYLHDTPAKSPFKLTVRAVSHGCVRLEKPLELAKAVFGEGENYKLVEKEMKESNPSSRNIAINPKIPVFLDYMPCFVNDSNQIQIRPDVYKLDKALYSKIKSSLVPGSSL